jgi:hypothetical protein
MTAVESAALRQLAVRVLAQQAGRPADVEALVAAARRAYGDLVRVAAPLIGQVGVDALTGRALNLAQREYPWLVPTAQPHHWEGHFAEVLFCLERQNPAVATDAAAAVLATFTGLLMTFIGEPLTVQVLRKAWPDGFSESSTEGT